MKKTAAVALLLALVACGKRGDPRPPVPVIPRATSDLAVAQRGPNVILSWSYPSLTTAGRSLARVRRVVVYRYTEELPVGQPPRDATNVLPGDVDPSQPQAVSLFAKVPVLGTPQFNKLKERIDSIEASALPAASSGARLVYRDTPSFHARDGRPVRLTYAVVTEGEAARSDVSNLATLVPLDVPIAPPTLTATARAEGVVLKWEAPKTSVTAGAKPMLAGYNVYRGDEPNPINTAPVTATTYTDVPPYGEQSYRVTALAAAGPPRVESDPSPAAGATYKDLLPPPTPTGVTALVETKAVRLVWDPVEATDLAGYKVYRSEGSGEALRVVARIRLTPQPLTVTNFRDTNVNVGISYFYEVTAVDKSGNESKAAKTEWVLAPKTP